MGTEVSCYPSRSKRSGCSGGTRVTAIPACQAPHSSTQGNQEPTGHIQPLESLEMVLAKSRALPGCQLLLAVCTHPVAIITSSSLPEKNKLLYREGKAPSLSAVAEMFAASKFPGQAPALD